MSQNHLAARRQHILRCARACFARHGYEGATVRRLEEETGLSRGAIFHHFRDKESLFLSVAQDDAAEMIATVTEYGLVQVMRDLLTRSGQSETAGWLGTQLEVSRRLRTDPAFADRWAERSASITAATRERLARQRDAGTLRTDVPLEVLAQFLELAYRGLVLSLATGSPTDRLTEVLDVVETAVRRQRRATSPVSRLAWTVERPEGSE